ncbi:site-2 protease family protein [Herbaspirillum sp. WGmk3]|jgi:Zn-dependent protease|uniref:site-2 protease family protein n=1 Tax=Herbaspirillum sp. WGmk3 TaxID=2919925 RepID=UPI0020913C64|nr:site-2 protease family protein [Herbaspirillum sp. WGmk3]MCO4857543.1 site-2 protease family protein [Herbaspirillum sp. WGmk3]
MIKLLVLALSGLKFGKLLASGGSMLLSLLGYTLIFGWRYALGFVCMLLIHEYGHYWAARNRRLDVGLPTFIPFVGAWIEMKDKPLDAETEAYVGLAGPLAGSIAALACYFAARQLDSSLLLAISYSGFFLNLFNLIPLSPFDGGRITAVLSPRIWFAGVPVLIALFVYHPSPMLILVAILALPQLRLAWNYDPSHPDNARYYGVPLSTKLNYSTCYLALIAFLAMMVLGVHDMLGTVRVMH